MDRREDEWLLDRLDASLVRQARRIINESNRAVGGANLKLDGGRRHDEVDAVLALQPLLRNLHMQETEESGAETEAERLRILRLADEARIVEAQLLDRIAQRRILIGLGRIEARENHRLQFLETFERLGRRIVGIGERVADAHVLHAADVRDDEADLARPERFRRRLMRGKVA